MAKYVGTDGDWVERENLLSLARAVDPTTLAAFKAHPPRPGMSCAEVGAGAGTIASWLCHQVGPNGRVVATDLETKWLELLDEPNLEIRRADITTDALGDREFDLVHVRAVLNHVDAAAALANVTAAIRRGGWLLVEEPDYGTIHIMHPPVEVWERFWAALASLQSAAGGDAFVGRKLPYLLHTAGLIADEPALGRLRLTDEFYAATAGRAVPVLVNAGLLSAEDAAELAGLPRGEESFLWGPLQVKIWARKPVDT
jgi:2-polyprenyl-3-methyl-5-hydroxy-6-metoxy-1,4-benzoquinol methylase